jgi:ubiquinone/menaquinone biosynthesis C-methylase UbiE
MLLEAEERIVAGMSAETFQIPIEAAEQYEANFVPAFFSQWAARLCVAAGVAPGQRVLDVACGTGIVARTASEIVGADGAVVGVDLNEAMLTVARRVAPDLDWRAGDAGALPVDDAAFDVVLCQMGLMFFPDRQQAVREMARAARPGATVAVVVPSGLAAQPAYKPFVEMAASHAGPEAVNLLSTYFACGDADELVAAMRSAGLTDITVATEMGVMRAPTIDDLVTAEVESTPLVDRITPAVYERIRAGARDVLQPFTNPDGTLAAPFESLIVTARRHRNERV